MEEYIEFNPRDHFNIHKIFQISYSCLEVIYRTEFPLSQEYKELVIKLHDNVIEYNFLSQAGLIRSAS
jgi:hypothetical protein